MGAASANARGPGAAPCVWPSDAAKLALRPLGLGAVRLSETGFWGDRQRVNGEATIPLGRTRLERAGNLHNLRLAAGLASEGYRGPVYQDSDVYKWLEGVAWEIGRRDSEELAAVQSEMSSLVSRAQTSEGYLNSYYQTHPEEPRFSDLAHGHELYCAGHLIQAALAQRRATGDEQLYVVARRFADYLAAVFGRGRRAGVPGHPEIEMALVELYRESGEERYLDLARYFVEARGAGLLADVRFGPAYYQDRVPLREATSLEGHAVRALYLTAGATDVAIETADAQLLDALVAQWRDMVACKTYLTGGLGSRWEGEAFGEAFELPADRAYCETCAAIASVMWSWRLLLATGEGRYADLIERTLYNAALPSVSADGTAFFYVNPLELRHGDDAMSSRSPGRGRQPWYGTACCPTNLMRFLASVEQYACTTTGEALQVHQYMSGSVSHELRGGTFAFDLETGYPFDGEVRIAVVSAPASPVELSLRIPSWCRAARASYPGSGPLRADAVDYLSLRRVWQPGETLTVDLEMPVRRTRAIRAVDAAYGCQALERGPLVYCLEQVDLGERDLGDTRIAAGEVVPLPHPRLSGMVGLSVPLVTLAGSGGHDWPYGEELAGERYGPQAPGIATPYFAWARAAVGPMRVWLPSAERAPA
jgi:DUF1680 family protein